MANNWTALGKYQDIVRNVSVIRIHTHIIYDYSRMEQYTLYMVTLEIKWYKNNNNKIFNLSHKVIQNQCEVQHKNKWKYARVQIQKKGFKNAVKGFFKDFTDFSSWKYLCYKFKAGKAQVTLVRLLLDPLNDSW